MAFNIKNEEADRLVRELTAVTGESLTAAVTLALRERLDRERGRRGGDRLERIARRRVRFSRLAIVDDRGADTILGYDEHGAPT